MLLCVVIGKPHARVTKNPGLDFAYSMQFFIFESVAKKDTVASDIDLLVITDNRSCSDVLKQLSGTEVRRLQHLGRVSNATIYTVGDVQQRLQSGHAF